MKSLCDWAKWVLYVLMQVLFFIGFKFNGWVVVLFFSDKLFRAKTVRGVKGLCIV